MIGGQIFYEAVWVLPEGQSTTVTTTGWRETRAWGGTATGEALHEKNSTSIVYRVNLFYS